MQCRELPERLSASPAIEGPIDGRRFENLAGVAEVIRVTKPYKLITLDLRPDKTVVRVGDATIGDNELAIIAGPCAIESRDQAFADGGSSAAERCAFFPRMRLETPNIALHVPRLGRKGLGDHVTAIREEFGLKDRHRSR